MVHELSALPYAYDELEPYIDARTMEIHHDKHHAAYINNLNAALAKHPELESKSLDALIAKLNNLPEDIRTAVRNNGGGHWNHTFFWNVMGKNDGSGPKGVLANAIQKNFGSFDQFQEKFIHAGATRFGSGWAWLVVNEQGELSVVSTPNQDNPLMDASDASGTPILSVDVWEHAYYLKYQNRRPDYLKAFFNVINWDAVSENYAGAL
jgi:Fe-Mn family superoxide dismutase